MTTTDFWAGIDAQHQQIRTTKPTTSEAIIEILGGAQPAISDGDAFFAGWGGEDQLHDALMDAGWTIAWIEAPYCYTATHPATGDGITYIEGDVYFGDHT